MRHDNGALMDMKDITIAVDEGTYRLACARAAELDTSVSALVVHYLESLAVETSEGPGAGAKGEWRGGRLREVIADFDARGVGLRMAGNLPREELYNRNAARSEAGNERSDRSA